MKTSRRFMLGGLAALGGAGALGLAGLGSSARPLAAQERGPGPIVLELFTSQGCSSCPPADKLLGELAGEPDILAFAYHVDYWNYIGWTDPFSSREMSDRQRGYARAMRLSTIYTPQLVIDGEIDVVGSRKARVLAALKARRQARPAPWARVVLERDGDNFTLALDTVGEADFTGAEVLLVGSDHRHVTAVPRGENSGRTLENFAVVRFQASLGKWDGQNGTYRIARSSLPVEIDRLSVLVQTPGYGRLLGAGKLDLKPVA